jgi:hypothetical protein
LISRMPKDVHIVVTLYITVKLIDKLALLVLF